MNFLAHFYLDRDHPSSFFVAGAATPDLLSIYNSGLRIKAGHVDHLPTEIRSHLEPLFLKGLERHFHADRVFHSSPLFASETVYFSRALENAFPEQDVARKYFVAHIILELLLDKVLIANNPDLLASYYKHFESLQPFAKIRKDSEEVSKHPLPNYESFLQKFTENKYLYHYTEYDHLIYILRRLLRRVGVEKSDYLEDQRFLKLMADFEIRITDCYEQFFTEIRAAE